MQLSVMQAYAEVVHIPKNAARHCRRPIDPAEIAEELRRGRVITSRLPNAAACALANDPSLADSGFVGESGKRRWTEQAAIDDAVAADVLTATLFARILPRRFAEKTQP